MKKIFIITLVLLITSAFAYAERGERLTENGYDLHVSATKLSSELLVSCRVRGGKSVERLHIYLSMVDESDHIVIVDHTFRNYSNSAKFSIKKYLRNGDSRWTVKTLIINN